MATSDSAVLRRLLQQFIRDFGLLAQRETPCGKPLPTSQAHALMVLLEYARRGEEPSQSDLARELGIDKSNVARICQRMESAGQIARSREQDDGRVLRLRLTNAGVRLAKEVEHASQGRFAALYELIPKGQRETVLRGLELLTESLSKLDSQ